MFRSPVAVFGLTALLLGSAGCAQNAQHPTETGKPAQSLAAARKGFQTRIVRPGGNRGPVESPPEELFSVVEYRSDIGAMPAYLSRIPEDGRLHPAIIWITGGFGNDIGDVWSPQEPDNDQSASALREAGIVMLYPAQRGGNTSPGSDETCYGEITDILAAADFLTQQRGVDPKRVYLGGHSTGGTKAMLAAECSNRFRAVFALGAAAAVGDYGEENCTFEVGNRREFELREPIRWLSSLQTPLYLFEGSGGNIDALRDLRRRAERENNTLTHTIELQGLDHFSAILPVTQAIARQILADTGSGPARMDFSALGGGR
jgi:pimeloyl-ACP methyl ester carboxylesterase